MSGILDTRDLRERLEELESEYDDLKTAVDDAEEAIQDLLEVAVEPDPDVLEDAETALQEAKDSLQEFEESDDFKEMKELLDMSEEISEWRYGDALIPADGWVDYVRDLVEDLGYISKDFPWWIEVDWEKTADNISQDYSTIDYQGETYYYRNV